MSTCWSIPSCASRPTRSTTCTCRSAVLDAVETAVGAIVAASAGLSPVLLIGAPLRHNGRLYNCALAIADGQLLCRGAQELSGPTTASSMRSAGSPAASAVKGQTIRVGDAEVSFWGSTSSSVSNQLPGIGWRSEILGGLPMGSHPADHHGRARRRHDPRQPLGLEHRHRQGRRPPHAVPRAVGPHRQRL